MAEMAAAPAAEPKIAATQEVADLESVQLSHRDREPSYSSGGTTSFVSHSDANQNNQSLTILVAIVAIVAIVMAAVAIARNNDNDGQKVFIGEAATGAGSSASGAGLNQPEPVGIPGVAGKYNKRFLIAMGGDFAPYDRIDPDGTIGGFNAELINLVGLHAGADFRIVFDPYANCWTGADHTKAGPGIMRKDYDGCAGWFNTIERAEAVGFTQSWTQVGNEDFIIRAGWTLPSGISGTGKNMAGVKLGFVKGWWTDAGCLVRKGFSNVGTDTSGNANEAVYARAEYELVDDLINALKSGEVDMAFLGKEGSFHGDWTGLAWAGKTMGSCARGGQAIFTRMDSKLEPVWNSGFNKIYGNGQFAKLCEKYQSELPAGQFIGCV